MRISAFVRNPEDRKRSWLVGVASRSDSLKISFWEHFCVLNTIIGNEPLFPATMTLCKELSVDFIQEVAAF